MAEAATVRQINFETYGTTEVPSLALVEDLPDQEYRLIARLITNTEYAPFTTERFNRWYGSIALTDVKRPDIPETHEQTAETNLLDMIKQANAGSVEARSMVSQNVAAANSEVCFKDRHIRKVTTLVNEDGQLMQSGQTMMSVYRNAIIRSNRHPKLQEITRIEALNGHRIEDALRAGELKDNYFVVVSIVPGDIPEKDLGPDGDGYFLDSLTFAIQATTEEADSAVTIESAFRAGVEDAEDLSFEERLASRLDIGIIAKVYARLGLIAPATAPELLANGPLIPKESMPNGLVDFFRWCDEARDEIRGETVERKPEDYIDIIEQSKKREASLEETNQKVLDELLLRGQGLTDQIDAIKLMWQLSKRYTVEASFVNPHINPRVFGGEAAQYIMQIRQHIEEHGTNDLSELNLLKNKAHETAVATGCGGGASARAHHG